MDDVRDLLVEIGTEELPPTALRRLSAALEAGFRDQLAHNKLNFKKIDSFATPRRLAFIVRDLATHQADQHIVRKGPALSAAYDAHGHPTKAAIGFARSCGVPMQELKQEKTQKGTWLVHHLLHSGEKTDDLVVDLTTKALEKLPIPKRMRWGTREDEFVRPVHWVVILFGEELVAGKLFGINSDALTRGHRFHHPAVISIPSASKYAEILRSQGMVEPSLDVRREMIRSQVKSLATEAGGTALIEEDLLEEVTALCEWPSAIIGSFDEGFLEVPSEVLIETMQKNQKYFPVVSKNGGLLPYFITISNIQSRDPSQVRAGNERVIRPRFSDASFFWKQDLKQSLGDYAPKLQKVVFQETLGTLAEKSARVQLICRRIARLLSTDEKLAARAAQLAKCDLMTQMIFEFPTLQGVMGRYYAEKAGEHPCVVSAMDQQYLPRYAGDALPQSECGQILSLADKIDTLIGIFAIGQRPTGVKDPYGLRRAAIGILRILIETPLALDVFEILEFAADVLRDKIDVTTSAVEVFDYCMERLKGYYHEKNISGDIVDSVLAVHPRVPSDIHCRILAVQDFQTFSQASALIAMYKRVRNILRKCSDVVPESVDPTLLLEDAEQRLQESVLSLQAKMKPLLDAQDYHGALTMLVGLRANVDAFFDQIMVMTELDKIRRNRLALLQTVETIFLQIADISLLR